MLFAIFVITLAAAVAIGGYTFRVLFGNWANPPKGPFVAPPPAKPIQPFVPFIPPVESAPVRAASPLPEFRPVPAVTEQATGISSVFVSLPMPEHVFPPPPVPMPAIARGTTANHAVAKGSMIPQTPPPRTQRSAKGSVPPPLPAKPSFRPSLKSSRPIQPEDFLDNEATNVDVIPTPHR
ncbi:MAG TPA: hypothetical protein VIU61_25005 [Kofleriaceae bacterium]